MGKFINGMIVGIGVGLLVAPQKGMETRRYLSERFNSLRSQLPKNDQAGHYGEQDPNRVSLAGKMNENDASPGSANMNLSASNMPSSTSATNPSTNITTNTAQAARTAGAQTAQNLTEAARQATTGKPDTSSINNNPDRSKTGSGGDAYTTRTESERGSGNDPYKRPGNERGQGSKS